MIRTMFGRGGLAFLRFFASPPAGASATATESSAARSNAPVTLLLTGPPL